MSDSPQIVIAGASGYIGKAIIPKLLEKFPDAQITALSRSLQHSNDPRVVWKACDLFSLKQLEDAVPKKVDLALYLVHSMGPTAQLDQGSFADYDLILADNFARSLKNTQVAQLIYLGGLIPQDNSLSLHLQSRLEMEETFEQYQLPSTIFRAGLILGEAGSSSQILIKLVKRLPIMICPKWTQTVTTPVNLKMVLEAITESALNPPHINKVYDLAGCKPLTYTQMMNDTAKALGVKRFFLPVPFFTPTLSRLWVSLITNTSKDLVYPLIESLEHSMVARDPSLFFKDSLKQTYSDMLKNVSLHSQVSHAFFSFRAQRKTVRSVQRFILPAGKNAEWVKNQYLIWLPKFLAPFIKVKIESNKIIFFVLRVKALELHVSVERSNPDRQLLYIVSGILVAKRNKGRLEFRTVLNKKFILAAIHDYSPLSTMVYL